MNFEDIPSPPTSEEITPAMCEICFSTSHKTEDCDIPREKELLKNMQWTENILNAGNLRTERVEQGEGVTVYRIRTVEGFPLGILEIADMPRALGPDVKTIAAFGMNSFRFEAPSGTTFITGAEGTPNIEDILAAGMDFLKEEHERELQEKEERMRQEFGRLESEGSQWHPWIPGYDRMNVGEQAEASGLTVDEMIERKNVDIDYGTIYGELGSDGSNLLWRLGRAWETEDPKAYEIESGIRQRIDPKYGAALDRIKAARPRMRELGEKMKQFELKKEERLLDLPREEIDFMKQAVDAMRQFEFFLPSDCRARFREWRERQAGLVKVRIPSMQADRDRLGLDSISNEELESQFLAEMDEIQQATFYELKAGLKEYWRIKNKVFEKSTKDAKR
jgi:hypothetical protein